MPIDRRSLIRTGSAAFAGMAVGGSAPLPSPETIRLWPADPPGTARGNGHAPPTLLAYRPARPNGTALLVIPGGGYASLSLRNEGSDVARVFTAFGWTVFVLAYRLPGDGWRPRADAPIQDGVRALRLLHARAAALEIDPAKLGAIGFSAGGHLAATLATLDEPRLYPPFDAADAIAVRPRFVGLLYPVTTLGLPCEHTASRRNLLGPTPDAALVARRSPVLHLRADTPPSFLVHALDDPVVDPAAAILWLRACRSAGASVEAQFLEAGGHGFGMSLPRDNPGAVWPHQFRLWAEHHGA